MGKKKSSNVVDFLEYKKKKGLDTGDPSAKALAVKLVDVWEEYGTEAYYTVFVDAVQGDKERMKLVAPYVREEMARRGIKPPGPRAS